MIHPSYSELMTVMNEEQEQEDAAPVITSRYSVVMATSRRARQIVDGDKVFINNARGRKPLSIAVEEFYRAKVKIVPDVQEEEA